MTVEQFLEKWVSQLDPGELGVIDNPRSMACWDEMKADLEEMLHEMGAASVQRYVMDQAALGQQAGFPFRDKLKDSL